ncbi:TlpA family protein disulfide reductase [Persephonella sp.]
MKKKILAVLSVFILLFSISYSKTAPDFSVKDENGKVVTKDDLKGKPTFLIFWGVLCHSCREEMPILNRLYKKYGKDINFFAVVLGTKDIERIKQVKKEWKFDIPVLIGNGDMMYNYKIIGTPMIVVLDRETGIYKRLIGPQSEEKLEKIIKSLL